MRSSLRIFLGFLLTATIANAQINRGVYMARQSEGDKTLIHELKLDDNYLVHTVYRESPPEFVKTLGGFYNSTDGKLDIKLEFNSQYAQDSIKSLSIPYILEGDVLVLKLATTLEFEKGASLAQDLDGKWLFATRGPDTGQDRRGEENPRKTMKFLMDGRFQWIAYHTETFRFSGTGGGHYTAEDGNYTEYIQYFSRDNNRVGAKLKFLYNINGDDWHHQGKNSRGEPMYEIWSRRK
ncbi:hypothetical protein [Lentiprolixibacter aurantiacus]|uniref:Membrane or secreted protein n=1 Tax=Lentiprolixibacter aurantiacus TaxID=2993939 RepID=A0AAE3SMK9_9FLAO|nr:hypothetical protein [Lentiprolixibacter aurantiacus]MCX2718812.1 hypothetical protein [Lentiprolixibacter aurantiacus]